MTVRLRHGALASAQKGQALLIAILIAGMAGAALVYRLSASAVSLRQQDMVTTTALAQANEALLGRASADNNRPGSLPCPDVDNDGDADGPFPNNCSSYVGRLPWRTLELPDLRDGSGERLWYVLSSNFRDHPSAGPLNPDTAGQLTVQDGSGLVMDNAAIAIIIAPGSVIGAQTRDAANQVNAAMYLDGENGDGDAIYVSAPFSSTFNDRLLYISREALFARVVPRVAKEVRSALENYRTANKYYPSASPYSADAPDYLCDPATFRGRVPVTINHGSHGCTAQVDWTGQLPSWFDSNNWDLFTHYAVANMCTVNDTASQLACDTDAGANPLTVTGITTNARMLVIVSGPSRNALACSASAQCLEDSANSDGDNNYIKPSRFPASNDRMAVTCSNVTPCAVVP